MKNRIRKILIVDSQKQFLRKTKEQLERFGFDVFTSSTVHDAKKQLGNGHCFDLAIIDLEFTDEHGDGWAVLDCIRNELKKDEIELPVIAITENESSVIEFDSLKHKANSWMRKLGEPEKICYEAAVLTGKVLKFDLGFCMEKENGGAS